MAPKQPRSLHSDTTDLGALWTNAVNDYIKKTGKNIGHLRAQSIGDVMKVTEGSLKAFGGFRHDGGKVDKVRSAFSRHMEDIQTVINGLEKVGTAAGAFPPAMPVGIVFAACGHLLAAFAGVKADYDRVEAFFEHSGRFFERLSILENHADSGPLAVAIVRVFSAQLSICGIVEAMVKGKRFNQWLNALWNLEDKDLAAAYATMQASIEELGATVGYASYSAIRITQESVGGIHDKVDELDSNIRQFRSTLTESVQAIYASNLDLALQVSDGFVSMHAKQDESHAMQLRLVRQQEQILRAVESRNKGQQALKYKENRDVGENKVQALGRIKSFFEERKTLYTGFQEGLAPNFNRAQDSNIRQGFHQGTTSWLFEEAYLDSWLNGDIPILWIRGSDGVGKSFLAHSVIQKLLSHDPESSNTAYFYFRADIESLGRMEDAFACCAVQIAESNSRYAQYVAAKLREDTFKPTNIPTWTRFFTSVFKGSAQNMGRLYLVFDGLDEISATEHELFVKFSREVRREGALISVLVTSRPEDSPVIARLEPTMIDITKEKIATDLKTIGKYRMTTLPRLSKFRPAVKKAILRKVVEHADCILYVEHMLRRLSELGREDFVLRALVSMPKTLLELYKLLLEECGRDRSDAQFHTLKALFAWLAFSKRPLLLSDGWEIVRFASSDPESTLDLEGEIIGRSSRILELSGDLTAQDLFEDVVDEDSDDEDASQSEDFGPLRIIMSSSLSFQERSMRHYFRTAPSGPKEAKSLRTPEYDAHVLILTMCADMLKRACEEGETVRWRDSLISHWHEHFIELPSAEDASDDTVSRVVSSLHCILSHSHKHPMLFRVHELYSPRSSDTKEWYDRVVAWAHKSMSLPSGSITQEVCIWAANLDAASIIFGLARSLFVGWVESNTMWMIMEAWGDLLLAFDLYNQLGSKEVVASSISKEDKIFQVADVFEPGKKTWKTLRAMGITISQKDNDEPNTIWMQCGEEKNLSCLRQSIELMESPCIEKIETLCLLVESHSFGEDWKAPISYLDDALAIFASLESGEMTADERKEFEGKRRDVEIEKARLLQCADQTEAAFEILDRAIKDAGDDISPQAVYDIENICQTMDPSGRKFIGILRSWRETQWYGWFQCRYSSRTDARVLRQFARWAKISGGGDFLIEECLPAVEKISLTHKNTMCTMRVRSVLAYLHETVVGDAEKARHLRLTILTMKPDEADSWDQERIKECIIEEWMRFASMIHSEFQTSGHLERRESLLKELKAIPRIHTNDDLKDSHVGMLAGDMLRVIGPAREYYRYMNEAFETCIAGLEDSVSYNDGPSLRLLAKLLSSFDGLERDAQIAYSAQYSILDRSVEDSEKGPLHRYDRILADDTPAAGNTQMAEPLESGVHNSQLETHPQNRDAETDEKINEPASASASAGSQTPSPHTDQNSPIDGPPAWMNTDHRPWMDDEDRSGFCPLCDACSRTVVVMQDTWFKPMYLCLTCPSTDMCEPCYEREVKKRRAGTEREETGIYLCEANHRYLKGPMKGWKGVKNGRMRIGDEELLVTEWIKGLKEVRWKKAWEMYWLSQSRREDIDDSA